MNFTIETPEHFSPSTINRFISYRSQWFDAKILRGPFLGSVHMARGTGVEHGLNHFVENREAKNWRDDGMVQDDEGALLEECMREAREKFIDECKRFEEPRDEMMGMLTSIDDATIEACHSMSKRWKRRIPILQHRIECMLPGCTIKTIGYLDYFHSDLIEDLKVVGKTPKNIKQDYIIQGAIYRYALGLPVDFCFTVPLKTICNFVSLRLTDEEYEWGLAYACEAQKKMETIYKLLAKPWAFAEQNDIAEVFAAMAFPNIDGFWKAKEKKHASQVWGIPEKKQTTEPKPEGGFFSKLKKPS